MTNVYIDSNVIVASEIKDEEHHEQSRRFMEQVLGNKNPSVTYITSVFTFLEVASAMIRRTGNEDRVYSLLYKIGNLWKHSITPLGPIAPRNLTSFTRLVDSLVATSVRFGTSSADTIHAQTVAQHEIDYLVTWNTKHFLSLKKEINNLEVSTPPEALAQLKETGRI